MKEPVARSDLRLALGGAYYGTLRKLLWLKERSSFAREHCEAILPYSAASHKTPLMRRLRDVDMWMQENKVTNLRLASARVNGIVLHPGQTFSYWYLIGRPTARKGYLPGMLLRNGRAVAGVGGGLCQLSNLIFWMTLHTPLTVTERHRHRYEFNNDYREVLENAGLTLSGLSPDGHLVETVELSDRPFYVGVQFHPEFKSRPNRPHPLFHGFIEAALSHAEE